MTAAITLEMKNKCTFAYIISVSDQNQVDWLHFVLYKSLNVYFIGYRLQKSFLSHSSTELLVTFGVCFSGSLVS